MNIETTLSTFKKLKYCNQISDYFTDKMQHIEGAWNKLSGSETAQAINPLSTETSAFESFGFTKTQRMYGFG